MSRIRAHVFISGRVQGVYYRASTAEEAERLDISGWVTNLEDGRVEAVFEGPESAVDSIVEWCHTGSDRAAVESVEAKYEAPTGLDEFEIRH